ncbi:MAG: LpxI family protein [Planctomycetota bacterium]
MPPERPPIGLIAGQGRLPLLVAEGVRKHGARVCCVGLRGQYDDALPELCDAFAPAGLVRLGRWIRLLRRWEVQQAIMVGRVAKTRMHDPWRLFRYVPDWRAVNLWYRHLRHDRRNAAVLGAVADALAEEGIELIDSTAYIPDHLATAGVMTRTRPSATQSSDVEFGWPLLERLVELDIGQAIAVRDRDTIAVEAVEGTDSMIERAGSLCRAAGWTLLKTASPRHDMRADVPTIGVQTVERLAAAGGRCVALGVGRVILIDKPAVLAAADRTGVAIVGMGGDSS